MPSAPPAPVRLTITTGCFSDFSIMAASGRPTMSATPPGGNGTTIVIGWAGYPCATASWEKNQAKTRTALRDMDLLRTAESNTRLHHLHFIGSLQRRCRV